MRRVVGVLIYLSLAERGCWSLNPGTPPRFMRIKKPPGGSSSLETAVVSFAPVRTERTLEEPELALDLHAMVHLADDLYFESVQRELASYDVVLYELIVPQSVAQQDEEGRRRLFSMRDLSPPPEDVQEARASGLSLQLQALDLTRPGWYIADMASEDLAAARRQPTPQPSMSEVEGKGPEFSEALTLPTPMAGNPLLESISDALRVILRSAAPSQELRPRMTPPRFFLPGSAAAAVVRAMLWLVPVPETSILVYDAATLKTGALSPVVTQVVERALKGDFVTARRLILGQILVSSQLDLRSKDPLIGQRNDRCVEEVQRAIRDGHRKIAVVYGGLHCPDLTQKFARQLDLRPVGMRWRRAWSSTSASSVPPSATSRPLAEASSSAYPTASVTDVPKKALGSPGTPRGEGGISETYCPPMPPSRAQLNLDIPEIELLSAPGVCLALLAYFALGSFDWLDALRSLASHLEAQDVGGAATEVALYLLRHSLLLAGLSRWTMSWTSTLTD